MIIALDGLALEPLNVGPQCGGLHLRLGETRTEGGDLVVGSRGTREEVALGLHPRCSGGVGDLELGSYPKRRGSTESAVARRRSRGAAARQGGLGVNDGRRSARHRWLEAQAR